MVYTWKYGRRKSSSGLWLQQLALPGQHSKRQIFSYPNVDLETWMVVAANGGVLRRDGSIRDELATAKSNDAAKESRRRGVQRFCR